MKTPHGWRSTPLMDLVQQPVSGVSVLSSEELPSASNPGVLRLSCVSNGRFNLRDLKTPIPSEVHRLSAFAEADKIIISRSNTPQLVGASAYVKSTHPNAFLPDTLWSLRPKDKKLSIRWLSFVLNSDAYNLTIQSIAHGTSDSMKKIQKGSFLKLPVLLPPAPRAAKDRRHPRHLGRGAGKARRPHRRQSPPQTGPHAATPHRPPPPAGV